MVEAGLVLVSELSSGEEDVEDVEDEHEEEDEDEHIEELEPEGERNEYFMQRMRLPQRGLIKPQDLFLQAFVLASIRSLQSQHCHGSSTCGKGISDSHSSRDKIPRW